MDKAVIKLGGLHGAIQLRLFVAQGETLLTARLYEELARRASATDIAAALKDLISVDLVSTKQAGDGERVTLTADGRRQARMFHDMFALMDPDLVRPGTSAEQFFDFYDRPDGREEPSRWQLLAVQWKWYFRRNWSLPSR